MIQYRSNCWRKMLVVTGICMVTLSLVIANRVSPAQENQSGPGYIFRVLATNPGLAPGPEGGEFTNDFEPDGLNNRGEAAFVADLTTPSSGNEGVFVVSKDGRIKQLMRAGEPAPGGGIFDVLELGIAHLNQQGDLSFAFTLSPLSLNPVGANSGVYRYSHITQILAPVVVPQVTPMPGGGTFAGAYFDTSMNNRGDIAFSGIIPDSGSSPPDENGLGLGAFVAKRDGEILSIARPGDPVPGGETIDVGGGVGGVSINDGGDVAFRAHIAGDQCLSTFCNEGASGVYLRKAASGEIRPIASPGDSAPGGGSFASAGEPFLNDRGEVLFGVSFAPASDNLFGYFLYSNGTTILIVRPGDAVPGGGHVANVSAQPPNHYLNNRGEVAFSATLNTDDNHDGVPDTGLYVRSHGVVQLVARTGTVIPDVGTIVNLAPPVAIPNSFVANSSGAIINDRGQILFQATLADGTGVLLLATPSVTGN